jgi:hypothetical protein
VAVDLRVRGRARPYSPRHRNDCAAGDAIEGGDERRLRHLLAMRCAGRSSADHSLSSSAARRTSW